MEQPKTFKYFKDECPQNEVEEFIGKIHSLAFLPYETKNENSGFSPGHGLFFPTHRLVSFYATRPQTKFVAWETLRVKYSEADHKTLEKFLGDLGGRTALNRDEIATASFSSADALYVEPNHRDWAILGRNLADSGKNRVLNGPELVHFVHEH